MEQRSDERHGGVAQAFHWLTAILVLVAFIYGPGGSEQRVYASSRDFDRHLHETLGMSVFVLAVLRLMWRSVATLPEPPQLPRWMDLISKVVQWSLYALLFAVPLTAIVGAWLEGHAIAFLGGFAIAPVLPLSHDTGASIAELHTWLGDAILWLAGAHAVAALYHHVVLKDGVLASMLPHWLPLPRSR